MIWFHGCNHLCPGCIAGTMNETDEYEPYSPEQLAAWVLSNKGIEGITLSGGEPFEQPTELLERFLEIIKSESPLSVLCYTGNCYENLLKTVQYEGVLRHIDVLIDGEYQIDEDAGQQWRGSGNQRFHFLTERYLNEAQTWQNTFERQVEIELDLQGKLLISGVPSKDFINKLTTALLQREVDVIFT